MCYDFRFVHPSPWFSARPSDCYDDRRFFTPIQFLRAALAYGVKIGPETICFSSNYLYYPLPGQLAHAMSSISTSNIQPQPEASRFPQDVFYSILMHVGVKEHELVFLWMTCRAVSHDFRAAVERVFVSRHIKKTSLVTNRLGTVEDKGKESLEGEFTFSHIDPNDRSRAVFRETEGEGEEGLHARLSKHYKVLFRKGLPVDKPKFYVQIRLFANDTLIPVVKADWDALELTVDWKDMYTEWFREAKEHDRRLGLYVENAKTKIDEMREKVDRGEMDMMQMMSWAMHSFGDEEKAVSRAVRGERIARNVIKQSNGKIKEWTSIDQDGFDQLRLFRRDISVGDRYSDEDSGDDEEDEEKEKNESEEEVYSGDSGSDGDSNDENDE